MSGESRYTGDHHAEHAVLIVEDEALIAFEVVHALSEARLGVLGPAATSQQALAIMANSRPHAAVLDLALVGGTSEPVAHELKRLGIPFVITSGYMEHQTGVFSGVPHFRKPYDTAKVVMAIQELLRDSMKRLGTEGRVEG